MADILTEEIVLAVDQEPFEANSNWFAILYPLITLHGERLDANVAMFPNRARVWYMVQPPSMRRQIRPGTLWHGMLEETSAFKSYDPDRDKYQVSLRHAFSPGAPQFFEMIDMQLVEPDISIVRQEKPLPLNRKPLANVFLRGREVVLGPFETTWDKNELRLGSREGAAIRLDRQTFEELVRVESFVHEANQFDRHHAAVLFNYHLVHKNELDWGQLRQVGDTLDARPDREILTEAASQLKFSRSEKKELKRLLQRLQDVSLSDDLRQRISEIQLETGENLENLDELAQVIGDMPQFQSFVEEHIEEVTKTKIQEQITVRQITIQNELRALEDKKKKVETDLARLRQTYDERIAKQDEELRQRYEQRVKAFENQEADLEKRELAIDEREQQQRAEVERLLNAYEQRGEEIAEDMLLKMPILQHLQQTARPTADTTMPGHPSAQTKRILHLPPFLKTEKTIDHDLSEQEFMDQFRDVVTQRGFIFHERDLANFHVCMKMGMLTILGGQSGIGKSSLPSLYAEALGCRDEYLHVPVQPNWLDERELLGAVNPIAGMYDPSPVGLVERLIAADEDDSRERGGIYVVCFDEMNLARIEHYFAQFLSVMQHPVEDRKLKLFNRTAVSEDDPYRNYDVVPISPNTRFVGTINIDETTHFLTAKVLDRSQFISLESPELTEAEAVSTVSSLPGITPVRAEVYTSWTRPQAPPPDIGEFLRDLDEALRLASQGLGFRRFKLIQQYVGTAQQLMTADEAIDYQIKQTVLPRLRKNAYRFDDMLKRLQALLKPDRFPGSSSLLERIADSEADYEFFQLL